MYCDCVAESFAFFFFFLLPCSREFGENSMTVCGNGDINGGVTQLQMKPPKVVYRGIRLSHPHSIYNLVNKGDRKNLFQ